MKYAKPKHRIIADVYAKRKDNSICVSIQNLHTDPACANFDMNNINMADSDPIGETFTNYLPNAINRRNAVTYMENNALAPYTNSYLDSEYSVSVTQISVTQSRRNSADSQMSVKMSETNIKATSVRNQKHKSVNLKAKKKQRNFYAKRASRRASNSSMESQRITNYMQSVKYKNPYNQIQVSANTTDRQFERRRVCTSADKKDIQKLLHQNELMQTDQSSDDDQSIDESQPMYDPSNMLMPANGHHQVAERGDTFDDKMIQHFITELIKNSNERQLESLRNSYEQSFERNGNGLSRSGRNSTKGRRHKMYSQSNMVEQLSSKMKTDDMATSVSSSMDLGMIPHLDGTRSSFSDQSVNRMKTQSQNSKGSVDVGIQANEYDIASQTATHTVRASRGDDHVEMHQMYKMERSRKRDAPMIARKDNVSGKLLSESEKMEKLKKLLLPSK